MRLKNFKFFLGFWVPTIQKPRKMSRIRQVSFATRFSKTIKPNSGGVYGLELIRKGKKQLLETPIAYESIT